FDPTIHLLEGDRAGVGQRPDLREFAGEEALQHHRALLLDWPAHADEALDIDDAGAPGIGARRDAHRRAESMIADRIDGERVDLADRAAIRVDQHHALDDMLQHAFFDARIAPAARVMRGGDDRGVEHALAFAPCQGRRFGDEILHQLDLRGEPVAPFRPARCDAEQQRDRVVARTVQPLPRDGLADKTRVKTEIARIGRRIAVDIRVDLEIGAEIGIALEEGRVPIGRTNKDHLYIKRYRPRLRRAGDGRALRPAELFDADHAIAQRAFEE